jgi:N-acetylglucosaminyldiphosphoundecaprenol N-acetyl-beta-D-mannosaminyltransferase
VTRAASEAKTLRATKCEIAGVDFDLIDAQYVLRAIRNWQVYGKRGLITLVNPHSVMECRRDLEMRQAIARSTLTLPDGIGIILGARMLSYPHFGRLAGPELMLYVCDHGRRHGLTHYFYGGEAGVAARVAQNLRRQFPGVEIAGSYSPPFRDLTPEEDAAVVADINARNPDVLWLGLGAPKQEKWMMAHASRLTAAATIGVGAAFDFHSGNKAWCPPVLRKAGLEWAYRLACEPRRLWRRNIDSLSFLSAVASQSLTRWTAARPHPGSQSTLETD